MADVSRCGGGVGKGVPHFRDGQGLDVHWRFVFDIDNEGARGQGYAPGVGIEGALQGREVHSQGCLHGDPHGFARVDPGEQLRDALVEWRQACQVAELQHMHQEPRLEVDAFEIAALPVEDDASVEQIPERRL